MVLKEIKKSMQDALKALNLHSGEIAIEHPVILSHGDYSTNTALVLAKKEGESPMVLAEKIVDHLKGSNFIKNEISNITVASPGFINFFLSHEFFAKNIKEILDQGDKFGMVNKYNGKEVLVEYTDPNTFKAFHIGHLMSNAIGEAISRIMYFAGARVVRICYPSDIGLHIAKAVWAMRKNHKDLPKEKDSIIVKTDFLSRCYVDGTKEYEANKKEVDDINKALFEKSDKDILKLYEKGRAWSLEHFEEIYRKLGTKFDKYIYESEAGPIGQKIIMDFLEKGVFENSNGAVIFRGEKYGLHTRVFINSEGFPVYEAKDVGLNVMKFEKYPDADESIIITGNEQDDYFKVIKKVLGLIDEKIGVRTKHFGHGMLRFSDGKMSSRVGNVITGEALLGDVEKFVWNKIADRGFNDAEKRKIASAVSVGAIKYSVLRQRTASNIVYDFETSISFEGDSGPYLQYSYVRAFTVVEMAKKAGINPSVEMKFSSEKKINNLEKLLYRFPEVVERSVLEYEPHYVATYLIELAGAFNNWYSSERIIDGGEFAQYNVALAQAFSQIMKNGLWLLGIPVLNKM